MTRQFYVAWKSGLPRRRRKITPIVRLAFLLTFYVFEPERMILEKGNRCQNRTIFKVIAQISFLEAQVIGTYQ